MAHGSGRKANEPAASHLDQGHFPRPHPSVPPEHLFAMKLAAGTDKDERDAIRLIAKVKDLDVEATRDLVRKFLGPGLLGRLEECLRRAGHPRARRAHSLGS